MAAASRDVLEITKDGQDFFIAVGVGDHGAAVPCRFAVGKGRMHFEFLLFAISDCKDERFPEKKRVLGHVESEKFMEIGEPGCIGMLQEAEYLPGPGDSARKHIENPVDDSGYLLYGVKLAFQPAVVRHFPIPVAQGGMFAGVPRCSLPLRGW